MIEDCEVAFLASPASLKILVDSLLRSSKCCRSEFHCFAYLMLIVLFDHLSKVVAIPDEASASAILFCEQIVPNINKIKKVFSILKSILEVNPAVSTSVVHSTVED